MTPTILPRCGECDAPAVIRYALANADEQPKRALRTRALLRCAAHNPFTSPTLLGGFAPRFVVVDPEFSRRATGPRCDCGLPAGHRQPASGDGRRCLSPDDAAVLRELADGYLFPVEPGDTIVRLPHLPDVRPARARTLAEYYGEDVADTAKLPRVPDFDAGCSCGWRGWGRDIDEHREVCPLPDPSDLGPDGDVVETHRFEPDGLGRCFTCGESYGDEYGETRTVDGYLLARHYELTDGRDL